MSETAPDLTTMQIQDGDSNEICLAKTVVQMDGMHQFIKHYAGTGENMARFVPRVQAEFEQLLREATVYADECLNARDL